MAPALLTRMSSWSTRVGHLVRQAAALRLGGEVGRDRDAGALLRELGGHLLAHLGLARRDVDRHAGVDEALGDHRADAAAPAGDECGLAGDVEEVRTRSSAHCCRWAHGAASASALRTITLAPTRREPSSTKKRGLWCMPLDPSAAAPPTKK